MAIETVIMSQNSKFSHPNQVVFVPNPNPSARAALFQDKLNQEMYLGDWVVLLHV